MQAPLPASPQAGVEELKIGVISDTHDYLDPNALKLLQGVDYILHAGDIGRLKIILDLERIAPVTAVLGNTDDPDLRFPLTASVQLGRWKFLLHHIVNPRAPTEALADRIAKEQPHAVIFGHTHQAFRETLNGILFLNPGYAGKPRFGMPRSLMILHCKADGLRPKFLPLSD